MKGFQNESVFLINSFNMTGFKRQAHLKIKQQEIINLHNWILSSCFPISLDKLDKNSSLTSLWNVNLKPQILEEKNKIVKLSY